MGVEQSRKKMDSKEAAFSEFAHDAQQGSMEIRKVFV